MQWNLLLMISNVKKFLGGPVPLKIRRIRKKERGGIEGGNKNLHFTKILNLRQ